LLMKIEDTPNIIIVDAKEGRDCRLLWARL
jgi:hypothetical protein